METKKRAVAIMVVSLVATLALGGAASAAVNTFVGKGTVLFDSIQVGKQGTGGTTYFNGSIINNTKGSGGSNNPVVVADSLRVDGKIWRGGKSGPGGTNPLVIDDDLTVEGDIRWDDGSSLGSIIDSQLAINSARSTEIGRIIGFLDCVTTLAQSSTFLESSDMLFCWNLHIAGYSFPTAAGGSDEGISRDELLRGLLEAQAPAKRF